MMSFDTLHEPYEALNEETREVHSEIATLIEELEAADLYKQRANLNVGESLGKNLLHFRDEEVEHAMLLLGFLRCENPKIAGRCKIF